jgi:hypothetical protein
LWTSHSQKYHHSDSPGFRTNQRFRKFQKPLLVGNELKKKKNWITVINTFHQSVGRWQPQFILNVPKTILVIMDQAMTWIDLQFIFLKRWNCLIRCFNKGTIFRWRTMTVQCYLDTLW